MNALVRSHGRSFAFMLLFIGVHHGVSAQLHAAFDANTRSGCAPLVVYFSDQSTGATSWKWNLGNGATSTLQNPSATYFNPGTYTIRLSVKNAAGTDSVVKQQFITVYANPVPDFSTSDTTGCYPKSIRFTDLSAAGSGTITSWNWDFGDGSVSSEQNPSHVYKNGGSYNVTLQVTNSFGCTKTITKVRHIRIAQGTSTAFSINSSGLCTAPVDVQFNNQSKGSGDIRYNWNFGDGTSSTEVSPAHTYTSNGSYTVSLVAINAEGCRDTLIKTNLLNIGTNRSDFSAPQIICAGQPLAFSNTSAPAPSGSKWNFGDGNFSDSIHPVKTYAAAGTYTVTLINDFGSCRDSVTKKITVADKPASAFTADRTSDCKAPSVVRFRSQSGNAASVLWLFGDGSSSKELNPEHVYERMGNYTVSLVVTNAAGCSDTLTKKDFIRIQKPKISLSGLPQSGCTPLTIRPTANVIATQPIASYLWKFGDGTTSTAQKPEHVYTKAGTYDVTLIITTENGCSDSLTFKNAVRAGDKPNAQFTLSPGEVCNASPVHFQDNSTGAVDQWQWDFGDKLGSTEQNPSHVFDGIGQFTITLIASSNGCADTVVKVDGVNVLPPLSLFSVKRSCEDKYTINLVDESVGATKVEWDFGDNTGSGLRNPSHTYERPGMYKVVLKVYNETCWNINWTYVKVVDEKPKISTTSTEVCKGTAVKFSAPSVIDSNIVKWQWNFGDGTTSTLSAPTYVFPVTGKFTTVLTVTDVNGCFASDTIGISVYGPAADFKTSVQDICLPGNLVHFTSAASTDGIHPIVQSVWNFGDGTKDSTNGNNSSHHYIRSGNYNVSLLVKDSYGCIAQLTKSAAVTIAQPLASFSSPDTVSCIEKSIAFTNSSSGISPQYQWSFGDGTCSSSAQPTHTYNQVGLYSVKLKVTDKYGCKDSLTRNNYINISLPEAKFTVSDSVGNCPPLKVNFFNHSPNYVSLRWDFGDGSNSTLENPTHYYNIAGVYYARLFVTGPGGCTDSAVQKIVIKGPTGKFSYTPLEGCSPLTVNFTASTKNTTSFVWDFSDGNTLKSSGSNVKHEYRTPGEFIPKIILTDATGCNVPVVGSDTIRVYDVNASFTADSTSFCGAATVRFSNNTVSNDLITKYTWDFGDGTTASDLNASHHYAKSGNYTVKLTALTHNGCTSTFSLDKIISILAIPSIGIAGDSAACLPANINLKGMASANTTGLQWTWNFPDGSSTTGQVPGAKEFRVAGDYIVSAVATSPNGCSDTATKKISIHALPKTNAGADEWLCLGTETQLHATGADTFNWNASGSISCTTCPSPSVAPESSTVFVVTGINKFGCSSSDSVIVNVQQPFTLSVAAGDTICIGQQVHLDASGADKYSWFPSSAVKDVNSGSTIANPQTSTTYHVIGRDNHNCFSDTADVFIKVWPIPQVSAGTDQTLPVGQALQLSTTVSDDVSSWQWSNAGSLSCASCSTTLAKPKQTTTYRVVVKNDGGCSASDDVTVNVICNNGNLFIPNSFSPNGDGVNDWFFPSGTGINRIKSLRVFNRWGQVVFERVNFSANDMSAGWDGRFKGQSLSPDVYIWTCDVICENNETLTFNGDVTLLR